VVFIAIHRLAVNFVRLRTTYLRTSAVLFLCFHLHYPRFDRNLILTIEMTVTNGNGAKPQSIRAPNPPLEDSVFKMFRMDGKTVIITGGSGGIGYEIARALAEAGANVRSLLQSDLYQRAR
jgi:hypothetical protein